MTVTEPGAPTTGVPSSAPLLKARGASVEFTVRGRRGKTVVPAVQDIDLDIAPGETLGLVGESGCGKSTLGRALVRLADLTRGTLEFQGTQIGELKGKPLRDLRRDLQLVFQDPMSSLNPRMKVRELIGEAPLVHGLATKDSLDDLVATALERVGMPRSAADRYPHQFSGGQRQRIGIARALALEPKFIVADEPVSALDVSVQSQVVNLLVELQRDLGLTYLFVAHDLAVVDYVSDRVAVMYLGRIVEIGTDEDIRERPRHPYTKALLAAAPEIGRTEAAAPLAGDVPSVVNPPSGCPFRTRCPIAEPQCAESRPELRVVDGHQVACHLV
ncbi:ABC transporter ATP-binding protein [Kineosporia babensis]|uniref:ATP-binding cassette domain-containing protein n=1 Tax=Kineosporia babensis TaxID=499548 RepID=A0A9X1SSF3_9ACTN|nr:oligopeptide/dipeptide ABC transporter ATP-binding protein [Kineosporia babensis]MCD5310602.1 ATP-binding cassette domain-containing protein [Kineosporia babensis]